MEIPYSSFYEAASLCDTIESAVSLLWALDKQPQRGVAFREQSEPQALLDDVFPDIHNRRTSIALKALVMQRERILYNSFDVPTDTISEERKFLQAICDSDCIRFVKAWLVRHAGWHFSSQGDLRLLLQDMWFLKHDDMPHSVSAFEHVFCSQLRNTFSRGPPHGLIDNQENSVRSFLLQNRGMLRYYGSRDDRRVTMPDTVNGNHMLDAGEVFTLCGSRPTLFFGVSPEFEIALYTLVALAGYNGVRVHLGPFTADINVAIRQGVLCSAFPVLVSSDHGIAENSEEAGGKVFDERTRKALHIIYHPPELCILTRSNHHGFPVRSDWPGLESDAYKSALQESSDESEYFSSDDEIAIAEGALLSCLVIPAFPKEPGSTAASYVSEDDMGVFDTSILGGRDDAKLFGQQNTFSKSVAALDYPLKLQNKGVEPWNCSEINSVPLIDDERPTPTGVQETETAISKKTPATMHNSTVVNECEYETTLHLDSFPEFPSADNHRSHEVMKREEEETSSDPGRERFPCNENARLFLIRSGGKAKGSVRDQNSPSRKHCREEGYMSSHPSKAQKVKILK